MGDSSSVRFVLVLTRRLRPVLVAGVESIVADAAANRVVVVGTADAAALKARLEETKKAVEIISAGSGPKRPAPAAEPKDAGAGEKKADKDASPKEKEKKQPPEEKKPKEVGTQQAIAAHAIGSPLPCSQPLF